MMVFGGKQNLKGKQTRTKKNNFDFPMKNFVKITLILSLLSIALVFLTLNNLPPVVPLLYGLPEGEGMLVKSVWLISPAIISLIITLINVAIARIINNTFLKKAFVFTSFIGSIFTTMTIIKIILLVGSF